MNFRFVHRCLEIRLLRWIIPPIFALALYAISTNAVSGSPGLITTVGGPSSVEVGTNCDIFFSASVTDPPTQNETSVSNQWSWSIQKVECSTDGGQSWQTVWSSSGISASGQGFSMTIQDPSDQNCTLSCSFSEPAEWSVTLEVTLSYSDLSAYRMDRSGGAIVRRRWGSSINIGQNCGSGRDSRADSKWQADLASSHTCYSQSWYRREEFSAGIDDV